MAHSIVMQAVGKVRRLGQSKVVLVYEYRLKKSFNEAQVIRSESKAILVFIIILNSESFALCMSKYDDDNIALDLGRWVIRDDQLVKTRGQ